MARYIVNMTLRAYLEDSSVTSAGCPRQAPTSGVIKYSYSNLFQPYSVHRRYRQLPVSGRNMKRFMQLKEKIAREMVVRERDS